MKKIKILPILIITLFMTGCVKINANMKINKDKSMDYEIIMAFDKSFTEQANAQFNDESIKEAESNGFIATKYSDSSMTGYKFTKHIDNIDSVSSTKNITGSLDVNSSNKYLFTVKKGFLKNTYKAKLTTNNTDLSGLDNIVNSLNNNTNSTTYDNSLTTGDSSLKSIDNTLNINDNSDFDYSSLSNMDLKFEVNLPYKSISSNATTNNDKNLTWNLLSLKDNTIEFEFELYNYTNIAIIGAVILVLLIIIVIILNKRGKNKKEKDDNTISVDNNFGQANNISNVEDNINAQDVWTDNNIQNVQPQNYQQSQPNSIPQQPNNLNYPNQNIQSQPIPNQYTTGNSNNNQN